MKTKYLFGMLLSGAMLAACTADDDLNSAKMAQANPSSPVFTVSFDEVDLQNRGYFFTDEEGKGNKVKFEGGDKLSLYHGMNESLKNWQNAIYVGGEEENADGTPGAFKFTTQSMVSPGLAIMVYPADLETYTDDKTDPSTNLGWSAPVLVVKKDQDKTTKDNTPYISEYLNIQNPSTTENPAAAAGYGEEYNIVLKRAASTLQLTIDKKNEPAYPSDVKPNELYKVELKADNYIFTTKAAIRTNYVTPKKNDGTNANAKYKSWKYQPELVPTTVTEKVTTTDVEDGIAKFTLLKSQETEANQGLVTAYTRYGKVEVKTVGGDNGKFWTRSDKTTKENVSDGLTYVINHTWATAGTTSGVFKDENIGGNITATLATDFKNLDMDYLHIKDEEHLIDALKVFNELQPKGLIKSVSYYDWYLDGQTVDGEKNVFEMHKTAWDALVKQLDKNNLIHFHACTDPDEECATIKLVNEPGAEAEEMPALRLENDVDVALVGAWIYTSEEDDPSTSKNEMLNLKNVSDIFVRDEITLKNYINAQMNPKITIEKNATAYVDGIVVLQTEMENFGTIEIPSGVTNRLAVDGTGVLINREAQNPSATKNATAWDEGAVINNGSTLAIIDQTQGQIYNYGVINLTNADARTLITRNAYSPDNGTTYSNVTTGFAAGGNMIGTINLKEKTGGNNNTVIMEARKADGSMNNAHDAAGFIKIKTSQAAVDSYGSVANYVILDGTTAKFTGTSYIKYVEVQSSEEIVFADTKGTANYLRALIVPEGKSANIPKSVTVDVNDHIYVKGTIVRAGTFNYTRQASTFEGYFGGSWDDRNNIFSFN